MIILLDECNDKSDAFDKIEVIVWMYLIMSEKLTKILFLSIILSIIGLILEQCSKA